MGKPHFDMSFWSGDNFIIIFSHFGSQLTVLIIHLPGGIFFKTRKLQCVLCIFSYPFNNLIIIDVYPSVACTAEVQNCFQQEKCRNAFDRLTFSFS